MEDATVFKHVGAHRLRNVVTQEDLLLEGEVLVGREPECGLVLASPHISRFHAKLNVSQNGVYVEDLRSTNGTFINGARIKGRVRLNVGDELAFDSLKFRFLSTTHDAIPTPTVMHQEAISQPHPAPQDGFASGISHNKSAASPAELGVQQPHDPVLDQAKPSLFVLPEFPPEGDGEGGTQLLSAQQIHHIVERNRAGQKDVRRGTGPRLIVMTAPLRSKVFSLDSLQNGDSWKLGRDANAHIHLSDRSISNDHARLIRDSQGFVLMATQAKNGLTINGSRRAKAWLQHGDTLLLGKTELVFKNDEQNEGPNLADEQEFSHQLHRRLLLIGGISIALATIVALLAYLLRAS